MITVPFLIVIFVSGYYFSTKCVATKYSIQRSTQYDLFYSVSFWGIILLFLSMALYSCFISSKFDNLSFSDCFLEIIDSFFNSSDIINQKLFGLILLLTLPIAIICKNLINFILYFWASLSIYIYEKAIIKDKIDTLMYEALSNYKKISITMSNDKVYVGWIVDVPDPTIPSKSIRLLPVSSGYRKKDDRTIIKTNDYTELYKDNSNKFTSEDCLVVLPYTEFRSIGFYDEEIYDYFHPGKKYKKRKLKR